jgi:hypothetical protein
MSTISNSQAIQKYRASLAIKCRPTRVYTKTQRLIIRVSNDVLSFWAAFVKVSAPELNRPSNIDHRLVALLFLTAMAKAFFCPISRNVLFKYNN